MNEESHTIEVNGVEITVEGYFEKGIIGDWETPSDPDRFHVHEVYAGGVQISNIIDPALEGEIEQLTLEQR